MGTVSGALAVSWGITSAAPWGMEGEAGEVASSDCFIVGLGRAGKSQGRGTCGFQIVSKAIQITGTRNVTKATGIILIENTKRPLSRNSPAPRVN